MARLTRRGFFKASGAIAAAPALAGVAADASAQSTADVSLETDIVFGKGGDMDLLLDIYRPPQGKSKRMGIVHLFGALDFYQWTALLRSVSAFETYRALYHDQIFPIRVAELLILEQRMPRSLAACSFQINNALERIVGQHDHAAKRLAVELLARLTHADIEEIFQDGLHEFLMSVLADIIELGNRIQRAYLGMV